MSTDNVVPLRGGRRRKPSPTPTGTPLLTLVDSWNLALDAKGLAQGTIDSYLRSLRDLARWLDVNDMPVDVEGVEPEHLRAFLVAVRERTSPGNTHKDWRNLRVFFNWCVREQERTPPSPVDRVEEPKVAKKELDVFTDDEVRALFRVCGGASFEDRRDLAILMIFADNGMRVSGMAGLRYTPGDDKTNDVSLKHKRLRIRLKGGDIHWAPIGKRTTSTLDRYLRLRAKRPYADSPWLWLPVTARATRTGDYRLTVSGIEQMVERRGKEAGITYCQPHKFRRYFATTYEGDSLEKKRIGGWNSLEMVEHYSSAAGDEMARQAHASRSPVDRL